MPKEEKPPEEQQEDKPFKRSKIRPVPFLWVKNLKACRNCGWTPEQCKAMTRESGGTEQCKIMAVPTKQTCRIHGGGNKGASKTFRYSRALAGNPELRAAYLEIVENGGDEFDLVDEITLSRARLNAAITAGKVDMKTANEMLRDLTKHVQKNIELKIKLQGLIQKSDAEKMLRAAIQLIVPYIPDSLKARCFEELAASMTRGVKLLAPENVIEAEYLPALPPHEEDEEEDA